MKGEIALELGMDDRVMSAAALFTRIYGLHAAVETKNEEIKVEAQSQSVGNGYLPVETVKAELPSGLVGIVACVPNISGVNKGGGMEFPK